MYHSTNIDDILVSKCMYMYVYLSSAGFTWWLKCILHVYGSRIGARTQANSSAGTLGLGRGLRLRCRRVLAALIWNDIDWLWLMPAPQYKTPPVNHGRVGDLHMFLIVQWGCVVLGVWDYYTLLHNFRHDYQPLSTILHVSL